MRTVTKMHLNGARSHLAPDFFDPQEIWSPRNVGPEMIGPCMKMPYNDFHTSTKFLGAQISRGPNFSGPKFLGVQISLGPKSQGPK